MMVVPVIIVIPVIVPIAVVIPILVLRVVIVLWIVCLCCVIIIDHRSLLNYTLYTYFLNTLMFRAPNILIL
jgi:hypothetical protein